MPAPRRIVACFGEALVDFLARETGDGGPRHFVEYAGGAPANVAVGVARLGGTSRFIGMLGTDMFGDFLLAQFAAYGVDTTQARRTDCAQTGLAFVSLADDGERSFNFYRPPAADLLFRAEDFAEDAFAEVAILHVCSNSLTEPDIAAATLHGMRLARRAGTLVSMDLNLRRALWPADVDPLPSLWEALAEADLVKLSREELEILAGNDSTARVISRLLDANARAVVVSDGAAPVRWWTAGRSGIATTFPVQPRDTTAAGDAFVAGLLNALAIQAVSAETLAIAFEDDAVRLPLLARASACGALATTQHGAFAAMPDADTVRALIEGHGQ